MSPRARVWILANILALLLIVLVVMPRYQPAEASLPHGIVLVPDQDGRARDYVLLTLDSENPPAIPEPTDDDRNWEAGGFDPLIPSREDGQPTFSNSWFQWQDSWSDAVEPFVGKPDVRYLEVGVFEGRATVWMFENVLTDPSSTAVGVDLFYHEGLEARFRENMERAGVADRVTTMAGYSNAILRQLDPKEPFDIIYIDASHTGYDVLRDALLAWDLLEPGGVLIFDDYGYTLDYPDELKPMPSIDAFITAFRGELEVLHRRWQVIVRRSEPSCPFLSSALGPYCFYWPKGTLVDPRTEARVPLSNSELELVKAILRARPPGRTEIVLERGMAEQEDLKALRDRLKI